MTRFTIHLFPLSSQFSLPNGGEWYVQVHRIGPHQYRYLWPDLTLHHMMIECERDGYFKTWAAAAHAINSYIKLGGLAPMCDIKSKPPQIVNRIIDVLQDYHQQGKTFTAYDVTMEVRNLVGKSVDVPHNDVRDIVHELFRQDANWYTSGYQVSLARPLNASNPPLVYSPTPSGNVTGVAPPQPQSQAAWTSEGRFVGLIRA